MILPRCSNEKCTIADGCHCSGSEPPLEIAKRPQIVYLTFDDAFTAQAEEQFYRSLFDGTFTNPNGCAIRATHFITMVNLVTVFDKVFPQSVSRVTQTTALLTSIGTRAMR